MSYTFKGSVKNDFNPECGVNITVKGLDDNPILQATKAHNFETKQDGDTLALTVSPSSGGTEGARSLKVEVKGGTEKTTASPDHWEVQIKSTAKTKPTEVDVTFARTKE